MGLRTPAPPPVVADALLAAVCWTYVVSAVALDGALRWWPPLLTLLLVLPLLWRRRWPLPVSAVMGVGTTCLAVADLMADIPAPQLVATYTVAALCPAWQRAVMVACTVLGIALSILIPADEVLNLGTVGIAFAAAYALGIGARARRDRIAMLEERALRLAEERGAAATRERERIAREMHDILAHSMSMVAIQAEGGAASVRTDPDRAEKVFDTISGTARECLEQLRRSLGVLRAGEAAREPQPGLDELPRLLAEARGAGPPVAFREDGERRSVPPDLAAAVYRIVQESLTNARKHAAAAAVEVRLVWGRDALEVEVVDDGPGGPSGDGAGLGLAGMRERAAAAGGALTAGPRRGGGYRVGARLPLN